MKVELEVPDYSRELGLSMQWEDGFRVCAEVVGTTVAIVANRAGLISLARLLLTLANEQVPPGSHWHLDDSNALEVGSCELIIERAPTSN